MNIQIQNKSLQETKELMAVLRENGYDPYLSCHGKGNVIIKTGERM